MDFGKTLVNLFAEKVRLKSVNINELTLLPPSHSKALSLMKGGGDFSTHFHKS